MIYQWKNGARVRGKLEAQAVGERLEKIRASSELTAETVLEDARPPEAVLHPAFEWDDSLAAEEFRKEQARKLIQSVVVQLEAQSEDTIRAFVVVNELGEDSYEAIATVMEEPDLRAQVLARAMREFKAWQNRYRELSELAKVFAAASKVKLPA